MFKKIIVTIGIFLIAGCLVLGAGYVASPEAVSLPHAIEDESPCPAVGCASGECHSFEKIPEPDGVHELDCPKAACSSAECHAWDTLVDRYYQPSDMSLNVWILAPALFVIGLVLIVRKL